MLGLDGRLQYHFETRYDKINKAQYKAYLQNISVNLASLISAEKEAIQKASAEHPLSKSKVAKLLQDAGAGRTMVSINELSNVLQAQTTFQNATIDIVRKQLVRLAVVLSNLAESTKRERKQLDALAKWILELMEEHQPQSRGCSRTEENQMTGFATLSALFVITSEKDCLARASHSSSHHHFTLSYQSRQGIWAGGYCQQGIWTEGYCRQGI